MLPYVFLVGAILAEVVATTALKLSDGFTKLWPTVIMGVGYLIAFTLLGLGLSKGLSMSVGYAILGILMFKETIAPWGFVGLGLIVAGVVLLEFNSGHA